LKIAIWARDLFKDQLAKPNGHRVHWRRFFPEDIREIVLDLTSSSGKIDVLIGAPFLGWQNNEEINKQLESLPYLDELGQVSAIHWPGKANNLQEARNTMQSEFKEAKKEAKERRLSKFGGWIDGPKMEATGRLPHSKSG
jgi:hypothetical protein